MTSEFMPLSYPKQPSATPSSLPSPPISNYRAPMAKVPTFMAEQTTIHYNSQCMNIRHDSISDTRSELRPILFNKRINRFDEYLPSIQDVITPFTSPFSPYESYFNSSFSSSIASSPTPEADEDVFLSANSSTSSTSSKLNRPNEVFSLCRKGSIASILNSDPELKQLDEEESRCNYLSHFNSSKENHHESVTLKRGRPRQEINDVLIVNKKQKCQNPAQEQHFSHKKNGSDCSEQACQPKLKINNHRAINNSVHQQESPRSTKGLRHFSKQVCDKVAEKGVTTYNEVADELALDIQASSGRKNYTYDQKNIRRRVYDALNVLMAMNIIVKDKKVIKWLGIPTFYQQIGTSHQDDLTTDEVNAEKESLLEQIAQEERRQKQLLESVDNLKNAVNDKLYKHLQIRNLILRNQHEDLPETNKVPLPFFIITCPTDNSNLQIDIEHDSRSAVVSFGHEADICNQTDTIVYKSTDILQHIQFKNKTSHPSRDTISED